MDRPRKKSLLPGLLSRSTTDSEPEPSLLRTASEFSSLELSDDKKGALGLSLLYDPTPLTRAIADLVFIHGLGGGSRKTWSFSPAAHHFWPQAWLPNDPNFRDVRIHSFGYNADWSSRQKSILRIHDFAQSLAGALKNDPDIRMGSTRIILVGHSMGGCVAKQTHILIRQDETYNALDGRMHSIFFLGTPHRGSDMAASLENVLTAGWGKKPFLADLTPDSATLSVINDEFPRYASGLRLWSFYETMPMRAGFMNRIVVDKYTATLNFPGEEKAAMNADHRQICKFETPDDPNYKMLRNALITAVDTIRNDAGGTTSSQIGVESIVPKHTFSDTAATLTQFLGPLESIESYLATLQGFKEPGSCRWFSNGPSFSSWKAGKGPQVLWLMGRPATGKSIISSHVVEQLSRPDARCSYFFFRHSTAGKSTLSDCFRSLAFQMAMQDNMARDKLLQIENEGTAWDKSDDLGVWRKLFVNGLFKLPSMLQHFWVIDGLDECATPNAIFTKRFLTSLPERISLFATSRNLEAMERGLASLGPQANLYTLSESDTLADMRIFVATKLEELGRLEGEEKLEDMCNKILAKSSGSFLWVRLVLQEFENAWTDEAMEQVLRDVPPDLHELYLRMVRSIEADERRTPLVKSILTWVVLSSRPLTVDELRSGVQLDLNQTLQNMAKAVPTLCGQLVHVDRDDKVHLIHETAREFLVAEDLYSELAIRRSRHAHLASLILRRLSGSILKSQPTRTQQGSKPRGFAKASSSMTSVDWPLLDYACRFFSDHVYRCSSEDDNVAIDLDTFLKSNNVLYVVEHIAKSKDLGDVIRIAVNLRNYLGRRAKYVPPTDPFLNLLEGWITDLIRVATRFRSQLLSCPSSIHCLIPPLCPSTSIISRSISGDPRSPALVVKGMPPATWDDCLSRMEFQKGQTTAVSDGNQIFAVGLSTGQISIYDIESIQLLLRLTHPERVKGLEFSRDDTYLASYSNKHIVVWEPRSGTNIYNFPLQSPPLSVTFLDVDELLCLSQSSELTKWSLETGEHGSISWNTDENGESDNVDYDFPPGMVPKQLPIRAAFLAVNEEVLLAVGYRSHPVVVWSALELRPLGQCVSGMNNGIDAMAFNPNSEIVALVVSYNDGRLCVFNYITMELTFTLPHAFAHSVACSLDGRSLITGSSRGVIEVFEFNQDYNNKMELIPLYRIKAGDDSIRGIAFSFDALRFTDICGQQCRLWAPAALIRMNDDLESTSDAVILPPIAATMDESEDPEITSNLAASSDGRCVVAGKRNGNVVLFSTAEAKEIGVLCRHARGVSVVAITIGEARNLIVSADDSGRVLVSELAIPLSSAAAAAQLPGQKLVPAHIVLDRRFSGSVLSLLLNGAADRLFVNGRRISGLWELPEGKELALPPSLSNSPHGPPASSDGELANTASPSTLSSFQHPSNAAWFVVVNGDVARVFVWDDFAEATSAEGILLEDQMGHPPGSMTQHPNIQRASSTYYLGPGVVVELFRQSPSAPPCLRAWPTAAFEPSSAGPVRPATEPNLDAIAPAVVGILGFTGSSTMVFLDSNLWVCSTELQSMLSTAGSGRTVVSRRPSAPSPTFHARRHFFALSDWRNGAGELRCMLAAVPTASIQSWSRDVVFANGHRIIVVKGGLEFSEHVAASETATGVRQTQTSGGGTGNMDGGRSTRQQFWEPVPGSMHRRASNW